MFGYYLHDLNVKKKKYCISANSFLKSFCGLKTSQLINLKLPFNHRLFNHEIFNPGLFNHGDEKFMVVKSGVEKSGVEMSSL